MRVDPGHRVIERRTFLGGIAGSLLAAPFAAEAQQPASPVRIGFMPLGSPSSRYDQSLVDAFREGLREAGVIENRHVILDVVWISSEPDTSQAVSDMVERGTKLLIPCGSSASVAAMRQTKTIPILFVSVGNPVGVGLVQQFANYYTTSGLGDLAVVVLLAALLLLRPRGTTGRLA